MMHPRLVYRLGEAVIGSPLPSGAVVEAAKRRCSAARRGAARAIEERTLPLAVSASGGGVAPSGSDPAPLSESAARCSERREAVIVSQAGRRPQITLGGSLLLLRWLLPPSIPRSWCFYAVCDAVEASFGPDELLLQAGCCASPVAGGARCYSNQRGAESSEFTVGSAVVVDAVICAYRIGM